MTSGVYERIIATLRELRIAYEEIEHPAVKTTDDSAREREARGWTRGRGSKNILFHAKGKFYQVVTLAGKDIKARVFKKEFGTKDIRFAYEEEMEQITGCQPGSLPPFGINDMTIPVYVDEEIFGAEYFMFNPGTPTRSLRIRPADLARVYEKSPNPVNRFAIGEEGLVLEEIKGDASRDELKSKDNRIE